MSLSRWLGTALLVVLPLSAGAAFSTYEFEDDQQRAQFQRLTEELRCPKCQNQNIADSNAPIAQDLRREVFRMVQAGQNDDSIVDFMTERYGDFVIYKPRFDTSTFLLWFGPLIVGLIGLLVVLAMVYSGRRKAVATDTDVDQERLQRLLHDTDEPRRGSSNPDIQSNQEKP